MTAHALVLAGEARAQDPVPSPSPSPSAAPGTRAEYWRRLREAKKDALAPYRPTFLERQILAFEKAEKPALATRNLHGLLPADLGHQLVVARRSGVRFWQPDIGGSPRERARVRGVLARADTSSTTSRRAASPTTAGSCRRGPPRATTCTSSAASRKSGARPADPLRRRCAIATTPGTRSSASVPPRAARTARPSSCRTRPTSWWAAGSSATALVATVRAGYCRPSSATARRGLPDHQRGLSTTSSAPGLARQPDFCRLSGLLLLDRRDQPFNPHRGGMIAVCRRASTTATADEFALHTRGAGRAGLPARWARPSACWPCGPWSCGDQAADGSRVPFYLQEALSDSHTLRGYQTFRFRGEKLLVARRPSTAGRRRPRWSWPCSRTRAARSGRTRTGTLFGLRGGVRRRPAAEDARGRAGAVRRRAGAARARALYLRFGPSF